MYEIQRKQICYAGVASLLGLFLLFPLLSLFEPAWFVQLLARYYAPDSEITCLSCGLLAVFSRVGPVIVLLMFGWTGLFYFPRQAVKNVFVRLRNWSTLPKITRITMLICFFLIAWWAVLEALPRSYTYEGEGLEEQLSFGLLIGSILVLGYKLARPNHLHPWVIGLGIVVVLFFAMEEISWGQQIFHWQTPEKWQAVNIQNETNLHNLFNPFFQIVYTFVNLSFGLGLIFLEDIRAWVNRLPAKRVWKPFIPASDFSVLGLIWLFLGVQAAFFNGELTEQIFSVVSFVYFIQLPYSDDRN